MKNNLFHLLSVEDDRVVVRYGPPTAERIQLIDSVDELRRFFAARATKLGVQYEDLKIFCSSSMDFPDEETDNVDTIDLARKIRPGGWLTGARNET